MEALKRIKQAFDTTNHWQAEVQRVEQTKQIERTQPVTRVTFEEVSPPSRLVVASSNDPVVVSPEKQIVMPKPSINPTRPAAPTNTDSIAIPTESIADRVAHQRREVEAAHEVLNQETGQHLEYHQLLKHPRFREGWNRSASNEFGRLAQGIEGRIKGTDTIRFIHKHEIPADRFKDVTYIKFVCTIRTEKKVPEPPWEETSSTTQMT